MQADLRESKLVLASFLGGNPGVLVPVLEYLFVGFFHVTPVALLTTMFSFIHSLLHLDWRVEYAALATFGWGYRRPANQKINLFPSVTLIFPLSLAFSSVQ